jgi:hypothetical protein
MDATDIPNEHAHECAQQVARLFEAYGIRLRYESFDELESIIQDHTQELSDRLLMPKKPQE